MKDFPRAQRLAQQIQRELAYLISSELMDPRVGMITLTGVEVSHDYAHAKVFYSSLPAEKDNAKTLQGLQHAAGFLRSQLAHRLQSRSVPQLHFVYDVTIESGARLSQLIDQAAATDARKTPD